MTATAAPATQTSPDNDARAEVTLPIDGMTCASCVRRVERALTKVPGVASANVNLATEKATVAFDPVEVSVEQLAAAVEKAGYRVPELPVPNELPVSFCVWCAPCASPLPENLPRRPVPPL